MAARFPQGKQPEFPMHCIGTRKLSNLMESKTLQTTLTAAWVWTALMKPSMAISRRSRMAGVGRALPVKLPKRMKSLDSVAMMPRSSGTE